VYRIINYEDRGYVGCVDTTKVYCISPECGDVRYILDPIDERETKITSPYVAQRPWRTKKKSS
jgi:hypothetical protein